MSFFSAAGKLLEKAAVQLDKAAVSLDSAFDLPPAAAHNPHTHRAAATNIAKFSEAATHPSAPAPAAPALVDSDLGIVWNTNQPPATAPTPTAQARPIAHLQSSRAVSPPPASTATATATATRESSSRLERRLGGLFRSESHIANGNVEPGIKTHIPESSAPSTAPASNASRQPPASPVRPQDIPLPPSPIVFPSDNHGHTVVPLLSIAQSQQPSPPAGSEPSAQPAQKHDVEPDTVEVLSHSSRQLIRSLLAKVQARDATIAQLERDKAAITAQREQDRQVEGAALNAELKRNQALHAQLDQANATIHTLSARLSDTCGQWEANRRDFESRIALLQAELDTVRNAQSANYIGGSPHRLASPNCAPDPLAADLQQAVGFWAQKCGELERQLAASQSSVTLLESKLQAVLSSSPTVPSKPVVDSAPIVTNSTSLSNDSLVRSLHLRIEELEELLDQKRNLVTRPQPTAQTVALNQPVTPDVTPAAPSMAASAVQTQMETMRAVKEQLATQVMQLSRELAQLRTQHAELAAREDTLLELLGEREAEVEDLKEMLQDAKEAYKAQLEGLMEAVGQKH